MAAASGKSSSCEFSGLNTPLEPVTAAGRFLSGVLQDNLKSFHVAAAEELRKLAAATDETGAGLGFGFGKDGASLYRRIAELKEKERQITIEDIMYMLVLYKFKDIGVHLVPRLSKCMFKGRLEIWPCKDYELESIHSFEALQIVKEHLTSVSNWRPDSNVTVNWALTKVSKSHLSCIYTSSISFGYFLKSASARHRLDLSLGVTYQNPLKILQPLRCYILGFDNEIVQTCSRPRTVEAVSLIEKHSCALFGLVKSDEVITTSLSSLKRMVLEAVAFGLFLWESEEFVSNVIKLDKN